MGSPLGPLFTNNFLSFHEKEWLDNCPDSFKPFFSVAMLMTRLYCLTHMIILFLSLITSKHPNIEFTFEIENDDKT
jgi:hypothetical protein